MYLIERKTWKKFISSPLPTLLCCGLLSITCRRVLSAPATIASPTLPGLARPQMPRSFDRKTVQQLIDTIDQPHNASILKVGYFMRRGEPELPIGDGYDLLKAAVDKETAGTSRWFLLENLRAFAAFRVATASTDEGYNAYETIFAHTDDSVTAKSVYPLRQAVADYVFTVVGKLRDLGLQEKPRTREVLCKAWTAYALTLGVPKEAVRGQAAPPAWAEAIEASKASDDLVPYVQKILDDPSVPKNFGLLFASAFVLQSKNPAKAIDLLQQAKPLLPRENGQLEVNQAAQFYDALADLLVAQNRLSDAVAVQQERVKILQNGQGKLLLLLRKSGDEQSIQHMLDTLNQKDAKERTVVDVGTTLLELAMNQKTPDVKAGDQGVKLLQGYLASTRIRDTESELRARLSLGYFFSKEGDKNQAKATLIFKEPTEPLSPQVRILMHNVQRLYLAQ